MLENLAFLPGAKVANLQMGSRELPELSLIFRLQESIPLEKVAALEGEIYGIIPC